MLSPCDDITERGDGKPPVDTVLEYAARLGLFDKGMGYALKSKRYILGVGEISYVVVGNEAEISSELCLLG
jgi:hypothetical protein